VGPAALDATAFTARVDLKGLPDDQHVFVRVDVREPRLEPGLSEPVIGHSARAARKRASQTCASCSRRHRRQGWVSTSRPGHEALRHDARAGARLLHPQRRQHLRRRRHGPVGDPADGTIWTNAFLDEVPAKLKVAETLNEYRANYLYNLHDANVSPSTPTCADLAVGRPRDAQQLVAGKDLSADARYTEKRILTAGGAAKRAFLEYSPQRWHGQDESERVYRLVPYGRELDLLMLDMRSYRAANSFNRQEQPGADTCTWGAPRSTGSRRTSSDRARPGRSSAPTCRWVWWWRRQRRAGAPQFENSANGDGPVLGREFEIAEDSFVHQAREDPQRRLADRRRALLRGPLLRPEQGAVHRLRSLLGVRRRSGARRNLRSQSLDNTFGAEVSSRRRRPPASRTWRRRGYQFFGQIDIDARSHDLVLQLKDTTGSSLSRSASTPIPSTLARRRLSAQAVSQSVSPDQIRCARARPPSAPRRARIGARATANRSSAPRPSTSVATATRPRRSRCGRRRGSPRRPRAAAPRARVDDGRGRVKGIVQVLMHNVGTLMRPSSRPSSRARVVGGAGEAVQRRVTLSSNSRSVRKPRMPRAVEVRGLRGSAPAGRWSWRAGGS